MPKQKSEVKESHNIFAFIRGTEPDGKLRVATVALDGETLFEGIAKDMEEAKQISGIRDERLDPVFDKKYPQDPSKQEPSWKIKWVNDMRDKEFQKVVENMKKLVDNGKVEKAYTEQPLKPEVNAQPTETQPEAQNNEISQADIDATVQQDSKESIESGEEIIHLSLPVQKSICSSTITK